MPALTLELSSDEVQLLQMALYEYVMVRCAGDVDKYVAERYPKSEGYTDNFINSKKETVKKFIKLANGLRAQTFK